MPKTRRPTRPTLGSEVRLTHTGQLVGTPCYMAPEQAGGIGPALGPAVDVYAKGGTTRHPWSGEPTFWPIRAWPSS